MANGTPKGTKLVVLPSRLVERLRKLAGMKGVSISNYAEEALEQALRAAGLGISIQEAIDLYKLMQIQKEAGAFQISRESLDRLIEGSEDLHAIWLGAGRWYGEYLRTKLKGDGVLDFFKQALLVSWNLDEAEVDEEDGDIRLRCTSFMMSLEKTELLMSYIKGVMLSLGYEEVSSEHLRGMVLTRFRKNDNNRIN
jgi:hypothetical protein